MARKADLADWLHQALKAHGGKSQIVPLCRHMWKNHEKELRESGDLFFTWQYDVRWAANELRRRGIMKGANISPKGVWELT